MLLLQVGEGPVEGVRVALHVLVQVVALHRFRRVADDLPRLLEHEVEDVPVDLALDGLKVEILLLVHGLVRVRVHEDGQVLVDEADGEDVAVLFTGFVQEVHGMFAEFHRAAEDQVALDDRRLTSPPARQQNRERLY